MTFIVTAGGDELDLRHPQRRHITAATTAHALAQMNRFAGHAMRPYSVAEHSLLVCEILERDLGLNAHGLLAGLLHDAHEPYAGADMPSPHKAEIGPDWARHEQRWMRCAQWAFGVSNASHQHAEAIRMADLMALATERRDLMPTTPTPWIVLNGISPVAWVRLDSAERTEAPWTEWRDLWLDRYDALVIARGQHSHPVTQP